MFKKVKVKYHSDIDRITRIKNGDWIDLRSAEDVHLEPGQFALINLGVSMKLPRGYEANIVPRSSTFKNYGIIQTNHFAVIDNSYCGNDDIWYLPVYATRKTDINKNDRICQFRINKKQPNLSFIKVDNLSDKNRGGFGTSGRN